MTDWKGKKPYNKTVDFNDPEQVKKFAEESRVPLLSIDVYTQPDKKRELKEIAQMIMDIDHVGVQCDDIHMNEHMHQAILKLDKLDRHEAVRLLMHVIHVQQLQLVNATIQYDPTNPFKDMTGFDYLDHSVKCNSPNQNTLY